ncbi:MAG: 3-phosphoshikimate 1-carboxyvinyltransferase [Chthoniobacterales bacterium]
MQETKPPTTFKVKHAPTIETEITVPGDKSISHRAVMIASLSNGPCVITNFLAGEDCLSTMAAMEQLGVKIERHADQVVIHGIQGQFKPPTKDIDCGNSGTTMRLLSGILAAQSFSSRLTGDPSLSKRPMRRVIEPLEKMGAKLRGNGEKGCPPLEIEGGKLHGIEYRTPVASAQVKSAILLAGMLTEGDTTVIEPSLSRDHTERMLEYFLVRTKRDGNSVTIHGPQIPESRDFVVPGDISSAAFWLVAGAAQRGSRLLVKKVGLNPTRTAIIDVLIRMGARIREVVEDVENGEPSGTIDIKGANLNATVIEGDEIPNLIDEIPIIAIAGALAKGTTIIRDARELRVKETDRIAAICTNLRAIGVTVTEREDGMEIEGPATLRGARVDSFGDHRIAMAFAIAGLFCEGEMIIENVECVQTSYPNFYATLTEVQKGTSWLNRRTPVIGQMPPAKKSGKTKVLVQKKAIAIDGPAASGKSSAAKAVAARLGYVYVNSGSAYRALTWKILDAGIDPKDSAAVAKLLQTLDLSFVVRAKQTSVRINGEDAEPFLRGDTINKNVSLVASLTEIRDYLFERFRALRKSHDVIMEGRDIGTVVFPDATFKFYLDASPEIRNKRRADQGEKDEISKRDKQDSTRKTAPLSIATGATVIDTSKLSLAEVVDKILETIKE